MFHALTHISDTAVADVLQISRTRILKFLIRRGVVDVADDAVTVTDDLADRDPVLAALASASVYGLPPAGPARRKPTLTRTFCLMLCMLATGAHCGSKGSAGDASCSGAQCGSDAGSGGTPCTGQQAICPGHPYAACVAVQGALGHCVDWTMVGATACSTGPQDCPATLPSASFPGSPVGTASAVCVKTSEVQFSTGAASPGYCAAVQSYTDSTGVATCTPNPCGATGYCSFIHTNAGTSIVSCMWPV